MQQLAVTFTTWPVLSAANGPSLPLPVETGFDWRWVAPGEPPGQPPTVTLLSASSPAGNPVFGYSPQRLREGWLDLEHSEPGGGKEEP
jgi:hypothetical protein